MGKPTTFWEIDVQYVAYADIGINRVSTARILVSAYTLQHAIEVACSQFRYKDADSIEVKAAFSSDITHIGRTQNGTD